MSSTTIIGHCYEIGDHRKGINQIIYIPSKNLVIGFKGGITWVNEPPPP